VEEAIALVGLKPLAHRLVDSLSGGERQRAWIAMLVAQDSRCLLLDEPTSALDIAHQVDVLALVHRLSQQRGLTVIAVLHDINMAARYCDYLVALRGGEMIAQGTPAQLMRSETLEQIYGIPMGILPHPAGRAGKLCLLMEKPLHYPSPPADGDGALALLWQMRGAQAAQRRSAAYCGAGVAAGRTAAGAWRDALRRGRYPNYNLWVNEPALPDSVIDVGLRTEPNLELLTQMKPSFIVWSAGYGPSPEKLARIAPGRGFTFSDGKRPLAMAKQSLNEMAELLGKAAGGEAPSGGFDALMENLRRVCPPRRSSAADDLCSMPAICWFWQNCLFQEVLDRFGIKNAWRGEAPSGAASAWASIGWRHLTTDVICFRPWQ
jgi:hypothetical protein